jgi:hypothetical protein
MAIPTKVRPERSAFDRRLRNAIRNASFKFIRVVRPVLADHWLADQADRAGRVEKS